MIRRPLANTMNTDKLDNPGENDAFLLPVLVARVLAAMMGISLIATVLGIVLTVTD